jgi:hypothetical protein
MRAKIGCKEIAVLERVFIINTHPSRDQIQHISEVLLDNVLTSRQVKVWIQNRRQRELRNILVKLRSDAIDGLLLLSDKVPPTSPSSTTTTSSTL